MLDFAREASLNGEIKLTQYPLTLAEIVSWYHSKQRSQEGSNISLVDIQERNIGPKPSAFADFDGANTTGRIIGWVSGEFDFEALRADGKDIFWRHLDVSTVSELEDACLINAVTGKVESAKGTLPGKART